MTLTLSQHNHLLLPAQLRLNGKFTYHAYDRAAHRKVPFVVEIEQQAEQLGMTVRFNGRTDSLTLSNQLTADVIQQAHDFILDCLNGLTESAAGRAAA